MIQEAVRLYSDPTSLAKVSVDSHPKAESNLRKATEFDGGRNDQRDHGFFTPPCGVHADSRNCLRTYNLPEELVSHRCPQNSTDGYTLRRFRGGCCDRRTL